MPSEKNIFESFREVVQDLLVPELKAVKVSVDALGEKLERSNESLRSEIKLRNEAIERMIQHVDQKLELMMKHGDQRNEQLIQALTDRLDSSLEVHERLAAIEARLPRQ